MSTYYHIDSKRETDITSGSWWLDKESREAFTAAIEKEQSRMANSKAARRLGAGMVVGSPKLGYRGTR